MTESEPRTAHNAQRTATGVSEEEAAAALAACLAFMAADQPPVEASAPSSRWSLAGRLEAQGRAAISRLVIEPLSRLGKGL